MRTFLAISVLYFQFTEHAPGSPYIFVSSVGCFISLGRNPAVIFISPIEPLPLRRELWSFFKLLVMSKNIWWTQLKVHKSHLLIYVQVLSSVLLNYDFSFALFSLFLCMFVLLLDIMIDNALKAEVFPRNCPNLCFLITLLLYSCNRVWRYGQELRLLGIHRWVQEER